MSIDFKNKPILCLDFDGVIHSYDSGWKGADVIPDGVVPGAMEFLDAAVNEFSVVIYSSRSGQPNGIYAMQFWLRLNLYRAMEQARADEILSLIQWPTEKPPSLVTIDDRAITFTGEWPSIADLKAFKPWNKFGAAIPGQPDFGALMREAQAIVESKSVWKKFVDGTPLSNDIAVWMAEFAIAKIKEGARP